MSSLFQSTFPFIGFGCCLEVGICDIDDCHLSVTIHCCDTVGKRNAWMAVSKATNIRIRRVRDSRLRNQSRSFETAGSHETERPKKMGSRENIGGSKTARLNVPLFLGEDSSGRAPEYLASIGDSTAVWKSRRPRRRLLQSRGRSCVTEGTRNP